MPRVGDGVGLPAGEGQHDVADAELVVHEVLAAPRFGGAAFQEEVLSGKTSFTDPDFVASIDVLKQLTKYMPKNVTGVAVTAEKLD